MKESENGIDTGEANLNKINVLIANIFFLHEIGEVIDCRNPVKTLVICRLYHCFQVPMYTGRIVCTDGLLVIVDAHAHLYECM